MVGAYAGWVEAEMEVGPMEAAVVEERAAEATAKEEGGMAMVAQAAAE